MRHFERIISMKYCRTK